MSDALLATGEFPRPTVEFACPVLCIVERETRPGAAGVAADTTATVISTDNIPNPTRPAVWHIGE